MDSSGSRRIELWALVNVVMNHEVPYRAGNFFTS